MTGQSQDREVPASLSEGPPEAPAGVTLPAVGAALTPRTSCRAPGGSPPPLFTELTCFCSLSCFLGLVFFFLVGLGRFYKRAYVPGLGGLRNLKRVTEVCH